MFFELYQIESAYKSDYWLSEAMKSTETPDLSDLWLHDSISNEVGETASIDTGDIITIECVDGIYRTGEVYAYGKTYVRIIVNNRLYTAVQTDDAQLNLRAIENTYSANYDDIIQLVESITHEQIQGAA